MNKIQIKSINGDVLFEYESPENSTKITLIEAVAKGAYLEDAYLEGADLEGAYLRGAYLRGAYLRGAHLEGAYLRGAYLEDAYLRGAYLEDAYLEGAHLEGAHLEGANLRGAHLEGAYLEGTNLEGTNLEGTKELPIRAIEETRILPEGNIIGYKKTREGIVKLMIPDNAKRSHSFGRKCRAEYAIVLELPEGITIAHSSHDKEFTYKVGDIVKPIQPFDENWLEECASGIHFFITRGEAERY